MDPLLQLAALQFPLHSPVYSDLFLVSVLRKLRFLNFSCLWHLYNCSFVTGASPQGKTVGEKKEEIINRDSLCTLWTAGASFLALSSQKDGIYIGVLATGSTTAANSVTIEVTLQEKWGMGNGKLRLLKRSLSKLDFLLQCA